MEYRIRPVTAEDAGALHALRLTPGVMENLLGIPSWRLDQARGWLVWGPTAMSLPPSRRRAVWWERRGCPAVPVPGSSMWGAWA